MSAGQETQIDEFTVPECACPVGVTSVFRLGQTLFRKDGVFIHTTVALADEDALVAGQVFLLQKPEGIFVEWKAVEVTPPTSDSDWALVDSVGYSPDRGASVRKKQPKLQQKYVINFNIQDLKSIRRSSPKLGWSYLIFILRCGTTYPALHFHEGGTKVFIKELEKYLLIKKSPRDSCLYLVREHDPQALSKSFDELQLFDDQAPDVLRNFIRDPYTATLGGFAKVTTMLDKWLVPETPRLSRGDGGASVDDQTIQLSEELAGMAIKTHAESGFEMITTRELPARKDVERTVPLTSQEWSQHMDQEGRIIDVDQLKQAIFKGGVEPAIRIEVWKFLLDYYSWDSTYHSRTEQRKKKVDDYFKMKLQWKSISEKQENRFSLLKERKSLTDKDVFRTDRTHQFFQGEHNANIGVLYDVLMTYCMYNFDLGYVQGMSDLLAPILVVMENEVDAFWCFAGFMELVMQNFQMDQEGMKKQLSDLSILVKFVDSQLCNYLDSHDSSNMYFCFRWLLIMFKREFNFPDIMRLWEVLWSGKPCRNFHLLICLAILNTEKTTLMENGFGFTEILKHINDMSFTIDLEDTLKKAEGIYGQLAECKDLPSVIGNIIGLSDGQLSNGTSGSSNSSHQGSPIRHDPRIVTEHTQKSADHPAQQNLTSNTNSTILDDSSIELLHSIPDMDGMF